MRFFKGSSTFQYFIYWRLKPKADTWSQKNYSLRMKYDKVISQS